MSTSGYYPFGQVPALSQPPVTYDIVMAKNFPRVSFVPTEPGGLYQELVEVNGDLWFVTNATWDVNKLGWYQESGTLVTCNASQNAYAWVQKGLAGDAIRMYGAATNNPNVAVTWIPVFDAAPVGTIVEPLPLTQSGQAALTVNTTFNGSVATALTAFAINVQNVASASSSALVKYSVNNIPVWLVDVNGTLQIGNINPSQLNPPVYLTLNAGVGIAPISPPPSATIALSHGDYVDLPNDQTGTPITGEKTIAPGTQLNFGAGANIVGGSSQDIWICSGCEIVNFGASPTALAQSTEAMILVGTQNLANRMLTLYINTGLTPGTTFNPTIAAWFANSGDFHTVYDVDIGGTLSVTGGFTLTGPLTVGGTLTLNGGLVLGATAVNDLQNYFDTPVASGTPVGALNPTTGYGIHISYDSANNAITLDTSQLLAVGVANHNGITSNDNSVTIVKSGQNADLSVASAPNGVKVFQQGSGQLSTPKMIVGNGPNVSLSGTSGPNGGTSSGVQTLNFSNSFTFSNNSYAISIAAQSSTGWVIANVLSQTTGGFTYNIGGLLAASSASISFVCVGP